MKHLATIAFVLLLFYSVTMTCAAFNYYKLDQSDSQQLDLITSHIQDIVLQEHGLIYADAQLKQEDDKVMANLNEFYALNAASTRSLATFDYCWNTTKQVWYRCNIKMKGLR